MAFARLTKVDRRPGDAGSSLGRILYVEDDEAVWRVTERFLRNKYQLFHSRNSDEVLTQLGRQTFDLILLDIELAGSRYNGIDICRLLKGRAEDLGRNDPRWQPLTVPIVFVTAYASRYSKETLLEAGADDVVTKPVDYTRLLLVSSRLLVSSIREQSIRGSTP